MSLLVLLDSTTSGVIEETVEVGDDLNTKDPYLHLGFPLAGVDSVGVSTTTSRLVQLITKDLITLTDIHVIAARLGINDLSIITDEDFRSFGSFVEKLVFDNVRSSDPYLHLGFPILGVDSIGVTASKTVVRPGVIAKSLITTTDKRRNAVHQRIQDLTDTLDKQSISLGLSIFDDTEVGTNAAISVTALLSDGIDILESIVPNIGQVVGDVVAVQEDLRRAIGVIQSNLIAATDSTTRYIGLDISDSIISSEFLLKLAGLSIADSLITTEQILKHISLSVADVTEIGDFADGGFATQASSLTHITDVIRIAAALVVASQVTVLDYRDNSITGIVYKEFLDTALLLDRVFLHVRALLGADITASDAQLLHPSIHVADSTEISELLQRGVFLKTADDIDLSESFVPRHHVDLLDSIIGLDKTPRSVSLMILSATNVVDLSVRAVDARFSDIVAAPDSVILRPGILIPDGIDISKFVQGRAVQQARSISFDSITAEEKVSRAVDLLIRDTLAVPAFQFNTVTINTGIRALKFTGEVLRMSGFIDESLRVTNLVNSLLRMSSLGDEDIKVTKLVRSILRSTNVKKN